MRLTNPSQLVLANSELLRCRHLLVVGPPDDELLSYLLKEGVAQKVDVLTPDFSVHKALSTRLKEYPSCSLLFNSSLSAGTADKFDGVLVFLHKSKALMDYWLVMLAPLMSEKALLWLAGANTEGIKSWSKRLHASFHNVESVDSRRHCRLIKASAPLARTNSFDKARFYHQQSITVSGVESVVWSLPGVFSHGRLDQGTLVLLETLSDFNGKCSRVLDFGCGCGVIAVHLSNILPDSGFTLVDCDAMALDSAAKTITASGLENSHIVASDGLDEVGGQYDLIVSNPPFHRGVDTEYRVTERFLCESALLLRKGGELRIVANSFLPYGPILEKAFGTYEKLMVKNGFTVYRAKNN